MSYCRFSSDNWMCDVYAYEAAEGVCIHVSSNRYTTEIPKMPGWNEVSHEDWFKAHQEQMQAVEKAETAKIGGPFDGQDFWALTYQEAYDKLKEISAAGYNVPQYVFESLKEDMEAEHD